MMKKLVLLCVMAAMVLSLCACGSKTTEVSAEKETTAPVLDLTVMSSTIMFAEIFNMTMTPDDYVGRTVKMKGQFTALTNPITGKEEYAVLAMDATSCCMQGLDLSLGEQYSYPESYPENGSEVTVTGSYQKTTEDGMTRYRITNAVWEQA